MQPWMLEPPAFSTNDATEEAFRAALSALDASHLPEGVPRWVFLEWLTRQGWLLHGSNHADITRFEPRTPMDLSPDEFSKRTAVFASSDGIWALMYALRDRARVKRMLNMAVRIRTASAREAWSATRYFHSLAPHDPAIRDGRALLRDGSVYVLPAAGFERMPAYHWPGVGEVIEPHWANPAAVQPIMRVPVTPHDYPLAVRVHDADRVDVLSQTDPWGFPWLAAEPPTEHHAER